MALCTVWWQKGLSGEKEKKNAFYTAVVCAKDATGP